MRGLGLLGLCAALALALALGVTTLLRPSSGVNYSAAPRAARNAAGSATTHVRKVMKVPAAP